MDEKSYMKAVTETVEKISSQEILDTYGITEYTVGDLVSEFETAMSFKMEQEKVFKILDAADHSDIWKVYNRKIPHYVQTPVNNPITIIKEATKASIMPTAYAGDFRPLTVEARQVADIANRYFQMKWNASNMDEINGEAADYAYLHGTSGVLFGWNDNIIDFSDVTAQFNMGLRSQIQAKAYHPTNIFPDPGASSVDEMRYIFFAERKSKDFLRSIPRFQQALANIENVNDSYGNLDPNYILDKAKQSGKDICRVVSLSLYLGTKPHIELSCNI